MLAQCHSSMQQIFSSGVLLFICELRPDFFDFWGSGFNHGSMSKGRGGTVKPPRVKKHFYF